MLATRCTTALTSRALAVPTSRPETASGGLRTVPRLRLSRWRLQPTDTSGKIAPSYDRARRCSHLPSILQEIKNNPLLEGRIQMH